MHAHKHKFNYSMDPQLPRSPEAAMASHDNGNVTEYGTRPRKSILKLRDGNTMPLIPLNDINGQEPSKIVNRRVSFAEKVKLHQIDLVHVSQPEWSDSGLASMDDSDEDISFLKLEADADLIISELQPEVPQLSSDEDEDGLDEDGQDEEQTMELTGQIIALETKQNQTEEPIQTPEPLQEQSGQQNKKPQDQLLKGQSEESEHEQPNGIRGSEKPELEESNLEALDLSQEPQEQKNQKETQHSEKDLVEPLEARWVEGDVDEADMELTEPINVHVSEDQVETQENEEFTMDITKQYSHPQIVADGTVELTMEITKQYEVPQLSSALGSEDERTEQRQNKSSSPFQIPQLQPLTDESEESDADVPMELTQQMPTMREESIVKHTEEDLDLQLIANRNSGTKTTTETDAHVDRQVRDLEEEVEGDEAEEEEMELTGTIGRATDNSSKSTAPVSYEAGKQLQPESSSVSDQNGEKEPSSPPGQVEEKSQNLINDNAPQAQANSNPSTPKSNSLPNGKRSRLNDFQNLPKLSLAETAKTTTIPLAEASASSGDNDIDIPVVSLTEFLTEIGIKFYDDLEFSTDMSNRYRLSLSDAHSPLTQADYYRANIQLPVLEVYELCCKELSGKIKQGMDLFDELKTATLQNNPDIFREYFKASFYDQMTMKSRFHTLKEYTRQQAKQIWYQWRTKLIENIIDVLRGNLEIIQSDKSTLMDQISSLDTIFRDIQLEHHRIRLDILQFKDIQSRFEDLDTEQLKNIKSKLTDLNKQLIDYKAKITEKETELKALQSKIEDRNAQISSLKLQITESDNKLLITRPFNSAEIGALELKSLIIQAGAGLEYVKVVQEKTIEFRFNYIIKVTVNFMEPELSQSITFLLLNEPKEEVLHNEFLLVNYCQKLAEHTSFTNIYDSFVRFRRKWLKITEIDRDVYQISVKYPVRFNLNSDHIDFTFRYYSFEHKQRAQCNVTIPLDTILEYPKNVKFHVTPHRPSQRDELDIRRAITSGSTKYHMFRSLQEAKI